MKSLILATLMLVSQPLLALDTPVGEYHCEGSNWDGGGRYRGTVEVTPTGETFQVVWKIAGQTHVGNGFMCGDLFAVAYSNGQAGHYGLAVYGLDGAVWFGRWTEKASSRTGSESWRRAGIADQSPD